MCLLAAALSACTVRGPSQEPDAQALRPFLDVFNSDLRAPVVVKFVTIPTAIGSVKTYVARPGDEEPLPVVVLLNDDSGLNDWIKESAREIAGIGYLVIAPDLSKWSGKSPDAPTVFRDERQLADLTAVVRWLRRRHGAMPDRIGVVGWAEGANRALALAATMPLQACVACNPKLKTSSALLAGLRNTPLFGVFATPNADLAAFRKSLAIHQVHNDILAESNLQAGFMDPRRKTYVRDAAEQAWFDIYEFLAEFVEEFPRHAPVFPVEPHVVASPGGKMIASIGDVMKAVMQPTGVRGMLIESLDEQPAKSAEWKRAKAFAAIVAESGNLLRKHTPPRGSRDKWLKQVESFTATATAIMSAARKQDYTAARNAVATLANHCASCHKAHR